MLDFEPSNFRSAGLFAQLHVARSAVLSLSLCIASKPVFFGHWCKCSNECITATIGLGPCFSSLLVGWSLQLASESSFVLKLSTSDWDMVTKLRQTGALVNSSLVSAPFIVTRSSIIPACCLTFLRNMYVFLYFPVLLSAWLPVSVLIFYCPCVWRFWSITWLWPSLKILVFSQNLAYFQLLYVFFNICYLPFCNVYLTKTGVILTCVLSMIWVFSLPVWDNILKKEVVPLYHRWYKLCNLNSV